MARSTNNDSPQNWFGTRTVIPMEGKCGWCTTNDCDNCHHELAYYEKLWICGCKCNSNWVPQQVVAEREEIQIEVKSKTKRAPRTSVANTSGETSTLGARTEIPEEESTDSSEGNDS